MVNTVNGAANSVSIRLKRDDDNMTTFGHLPSFIHHSHRSSSIESSQLPPPSSSGIAASALDCGVDGMGWVSQGSDHRARRRGGLVGMEWNGSGLVGSVSLYKRIQIFPALSSPRSRRRLAADHLCHLVLTDRQAANLSFRFNVTRPSCHDQRVEREWPSGRDGSRGGDGDGEMGEVGQSEWPFVFVR